MNERHLRRARGFTLIEVVIAMVIFAVVSMAVASAVSFMTKQGQTTRRKTFATQKAIQMMEELRGAVASSGNTAILDNYNDGVANNYVLTTNLSVTNPADAASDNASRIYYRRVTVAYMPNDSSGRQVYVRVYDAASNAVLAETMSVLRTLPNNYPPSQVYDVYFIAIENVPGWWALTSTLRSIVDGVAQNLQTINPGLVLRTHWITQMAYGRDPYYAPYINAAANGTSSGALPNAYYYPGLLHNSTKGADVDYYSPSGMGGQMLEDGVMTDSGTYSYADEYNHAMRYPDEVAAYDAAVASAAAEGKTAPEISLRMLLEELNETPSPLQNLLLMNLHGEMLPMPPMRNYSDAAKDPANTPGARVVAHPQWLQYASGKQVKLRVYTYVTPEYVNGTSTSAVMPQLSLYFPGVGLTSSQVWIRKMTGGTSGLVYSWGNAVSGACSGSPPVPPVGDDYCLTNPTSGTTEIVISSSPLRSVMEHTGDGGLPASARLYGMEYIPSPPQAITSLTSGSTDFTEGVQDLAATVSTDAKNTARWVVGIAAGALANGQYQVQTRIGSDLTTGPASSNANEYSNQSNTYIWIGTSAPTTEQYQFMGDPRYEPYADAKQENDYNWYFTDISTATNSNYTYRGYYETSGGNGYGGTVSYDAPRFYQMYRQGLINAGGVWTTMTGWSFYYAALGGDMGDDCTSLGFCSSSSGLPINSRPWSPGGNSTAYINEINNDTGYTYYNARLIASATNYWVSNPWVGELYPDASFTGASGWAATGNLPTGASASTGFYRANYKQTFGPTGNTFGNASTQYTWNPEKRVSANGAPAFLNATPLGGSTSEWFQHSGAGSGGCPSTVNAGDDCGAITSTGSAISTAFNFPLLPSLSSARPYQLTSTSNSPPEWNNAYYKIQRTSSSLMAVDYTDSNVASLTASALVKVQNSTGAAYMVINGLDTQSGFGSSELAQLSLTTMLYGLMSAGAPANTLGQIQPVPLVSITTPTVTEQFLNPSSIPIGWSLTWTRWNGLPYTSAYSSAYVNNTVTTDYNVKYSLDNGNTWKFVQDGTAATFGVYDPAHSATSPVTWDTSSYTNGTYLIMVEAYRDGYPLHYAYQEMSVYIEQ